MLEISYISEDLFTYFQISHMYNFSDVVTSSKGVSQADWAHSADARPEPTGSNCFKQLIVLWIRCALRSCTFGTSPARVHSCENVWSLNLRQSAIILSLRLECD